jgi:hypothetical protein
VIFNNIIVTLVQFCASVDLNCVKRNDSSDSSSDLCYFQIVLDFCSYFLVPACCVMPPLETLLPGDPGGGVIYLRIVLSPAEASRICVS